MQMATKMVTTTTGTNVDELAFVSSLTSPRVGQFGGGGSGGIGEAVIKKCSTLRQQRDDSSEVATTPNDDADDESLDDSAIVSLVTDMELSMEERQRWSPPVVVVSDPIVPRKSMLPKPEIGPKPAHLSPLPKLMTASLHSPSTTVADLADDIRMLNNNGNGTEKPITAKTLNEKTKGTASMLKSTLKRMTKLSLRVATTAKSPPSPSGRSLSPFSKKCSSPPAAAAAEEATVKIASLLRKKKPTTTTTEHAATVNGAGGRGLTSSSSSSLNRNNKFEAVFKPPVAVEAKSLSRSATSGSRSMPHRSHSLKRAVRNKDVGGGLHRSGSGFIHSGGNNNVVHRSNSVMHHRRFRDRDLDVRLSRGTQTQLTKDVLQDDDDDDDGDVDVDGDAAIDTRVQFSLYMPDLLGGDTGNEVETRVTEPTEPVDVRRNRQLTLDNMKLHREIEKLKSTAGESDHFKRELRSARSRLEEEQRSRARIEHELDRHNEKVKLIAESMDGVEKEFEVKDANAKRMEGQLHAALSRLRTLDDKLDVANRIISSQNVDLAEAVAARRSAADDYERAETEAAELHEFLQAEKLTLAEALKEVEAEAEALKRKVESSEERCGHLVRLGERRHQEVLALESQLAAMEDKAKEMLLAQGSEISRSSVMVAQLGGKLEDAFKTAFPSAAEVLNMTGGGGGGGENPAVQLIDFEREECLALDDDGEDSLQNLSKAIKNRLVVESGLKRVASSVGVSSLVDRIGQIDKLMEQFLAAHAAANQSEMRTTSDDQKENVALYGNNGLSSSEREEGMAKRHEEDVADMKAKYLKHRQILIANTEQAEREVLRLDEIYHDTVDDVLQTLNKLPEVVKSNQLLTKLQSRLERTLLDEEEEAVTATGGNADVNDKLPLLWNKVTSAAKTYEQTTL